MVNFNVAIHSVPDIWEESDLVFYLNHLFLHSNDCVLSQEFMILFFFLHVLIQIINLPNFQVREINLVI